MHVRIAWEIYNHQKNKTDPKTIGGLPGSGLQPSGKIGPSSLDLLNKPGVLAGAGGQPSFPKRPGPELTRPHQAPASLLPPVTGHLRLPTPPSHFDPRDPYAAQRAYYGTSHLGRTIVHHNRTCLTMKCNTCRILDHGSSSSLVPPLSLCGCPTIRRSRWDCSISHGIRRSSGSREANVSSQPRSHLDPLLSLISRGSWGSGSPGRSLEREGGQGPGRG